MYGADSLYAREASFDDLKPHMEKYGNLQGEDIEAR
jgi:hypothetical protein